VFACELLFNREAGNEDEVDVFERQSDSEALRELSQQFSIRELLREPGLAPHEQLEGIKALESALGVILHICELLSLSFDS